MQNILRKLTNLIFPRGRSSFSAPYLIEIRLYGAPKSRIKRIVYDISDRFRIRLNGKRPVPHLTVYGPFGTKDRRRLVQTFVSVCKKFDVRSKSDLIKLHLKDFENFKSDRGSVVHVGIKPSEKLIELNELLLTELNYFCRSQEWDKSMKYKKWHATLALKLPENKAASIVNYLEKRHEINEDFNVIRLTLMKNRKILYEYDFIQHKLLNRQQAKSKETLYRTKNILNNF